MTTLIINSSPVEASVFRILDLHADYACGNSGYCCYNTWKVALDRLRGPRLVKALAASGMPKEEIDGHVVLNPDSDDPMNHGYISKNAHGHCSFVGGEEGSSSCTLQERCGHATLPDICQSFPRIVVSSPAGTYMTLTYSCPTAAKLLLRKDGLREVPPRSVHRTDQTLVGVSIGPDKPAPAWIAGVRPDWIAFDYFWRWAVEFVARPGLTPAQALYCLGIVVGAVEQHAPALKKLDPLIEMLDSVWSNPVASFAALCAPIGPLPELGLTYMDGLLKQVDPTFAIHKSFAPLGNPSARSDADRARVLAEFDARIRPRLPEFETIERNYVGSRVYANPLAYRADRLRTGYFTNVLMLIAFRFAMLAAAMEEGRELDEKICMKAAGWADDLMLHHQVLQTKFLKMLGPYMDTEIVNLIRPALF